MHRLLLIASLAVSSDALACGGLFCQSTAAPVDQAGERILFVVDEAHAQIEVQVQISYTGTASEFAWILPVPTEPVVGTSVDDVFRVLGASTFPLWTLQQETEGTCKGTRGKGVLLAGSATNDALDTPDDASGAGVDVVSQALVGPYESSVLRADDATALVDWLQDHDYYVPDALAPKLAPYVSTDGYFVALRLQKDKSTGDLVPVTVTYPGTSPQIPLQLTAVAAADDMPIQPFVIGSARAVPSNYLHVQVNPFAIDWINAGANYFDVISRAADEAEGQAFATDFSGPTSLLVGQFDGPGRYDPDALRGESDAWIVMQALQSAGFPLSPGTLPLADALLTPPLSAGATIQSELAQLGYIEALHDALVRRTIDGDALADALETSWIPAMAHVEDLLATHPQLTRLTSSMSADEMTADPLFVLNPDLPDVARQRDATLVTHCDPTVMLSEARQSLRLPDGRELWYPDEAAGDRSFDYATWLRGVQANATETIERTSDAGAPVVLTDHSDAIAAELALLAPAAACGCANAGGGGVLASAVGLLALLRRRKA